MFSLAIFRDLFCFGHALSKLTKRAMLKYDGRLRATVIAVSVSAVICLFFLLNRSHIKKEKFMPDWKAVKQVKQNIHKLKQHSANRAAPIVAQMKAFNKVADEVADGKFLDELLELTPDAACEVFVKEFGVKGVLIVTKHVNDEGDDHALPRFEGSPKLLAEKSERLSTVVVQSPDDHAVLLHHHHRHHFDDDKHISLLCRVAQQPDVGRTIRTAKSVKYPDDKYIIELIK